MEPSELEQGTEAWISWRRSRIGSSDAAVILGISPWKTRFQLWAEKTMFPLPKKTSKGSGNNFAMDRGTRLEPAMRAIHELKVGFDLPADIVVHPEYPFIMSSLDAYNKDEAVIGEYKVCGAEVFSLAKKGIVVDYYYAQVQQQLLVTGAKECHFLVGQAQAVAKDEWVIGETAMVVVKADPEYQKNLLFEMISFWDFVSKDIAPPLCDKDTFYADDQSTVLLFSRLKDAKKIWQAADDEGVDVKLLKAAFEEVKEEAIEHIEAEINHPKVYASGVSLSKNKNGVWAVRLD